MVNLSLCPLCHQKNFQVLFKKDKRQVVKCLNDGLVFVNPQPTKGQIAALYESQYFKNLNPYFSRAPFDGAKRKRRYHGFLPVVLHFKNHQIHLRYFNKKLDQIETRIKGKGRILDVGCGWGFFLQEAKKRGWKLMGVDVSDFAINRCRKRGLKVIKGTIKEVKLPSGSFSVVVSLQTIEHETNPLEYAKEIHRVLKPDGLAVFTTPDHDSWTRNLMGPYWFGYYPREHLFFLSRKTLKIILKKAGFAKIEFRRDNPRIFTLNYYLTRLAGFYPNKFVKFTTSVIQRLVGNLPVPIPTDPLGDILVFARKEKPCFSPPVDRSK